jgi:hypothetical protein
MATERRPCSASDRTRAWTALRSMGVMGTTPAAVRMEMQIGVTASGAPLAINVLPGGHPPRLSLADG